MKPSGKLFSVNRAANAVRESQSRSSRIMAQHQIKNRLATPTMAIFRRAAHPRQSRSKTGRIQGLVLRPSQLTSPGLPRRHRLPAPVKRPLPSTEPDLKIRGTRPAEAYGMATSELRERYACSTRSSLKLLNISCERGLGGPAKSSADRCRVGKPLCVGRERMSGLHGPDDGRMNHSRYARSIAIVSRPNG